MGLPTTTNIFTADIPKFMTKKRLLCLGYGYCAKFIHKILPKQEWNLQGTTRQEPSSEHLISLDLSSPPSPFLKKSLEKATHLLISAPPTDQGDPILRYLQEYQLQPLSCQWVGYFSTTGVYGNSDGEWIDETFPLNPSSARSRARLQAELAWQNFSQERHLSCAIMRLSGIYGPNRSAFDRLQIGKATMPYKPEHFFNRIHVEDIATQTLALMESTQSGCFNFADATPAPAHLPLEFAADLLKIPAPKRVPYDEAKTTLSKFANEFYLDNKRIKADKLIQTTGKSLRYPSYQDGLLEIFKKNRPQK